MQHEGVKALSARQGYNLVAKQYAKWHWYRFWRANEGPIIRNWLKTVGSVGLDAGCGNAPYLSDYNFDKSKRILIDFSEGMLAEALLRINKYSKFEPYLKKSIVIIQADIRYLPLEDKYVDYILCCRVLSNIPEFDKTLSEFARVLKPGGSVFLTDIHPLHIYDYTGVNTDTGRINIETYKHEIKCLIEQANFLGLVLDEYQEFNLLNLKKMPPIKNFEKLHANPTTPIFYAIKFKKN